MGFYRVNYDDNNWNSIKGILLSSSFSKVMHQDIKTSVDAGALLGASLRELASEAAAVCTASNEQRRGDSELSTINKARRGSDAYLIYIYGLPLVMQSESRFYTYLARLND